MSGPTHPADPMRRLNRAQSLLARIRHRQLRLARCGKVAESAAYARRAVRVRQTVCL